MIENFANVAKEISESIKDIKEYAPEFLKGEAKSSESKVDILKPVETTQIGLTDEQKEIIKTDFGWNDEKIEQLESWEQFESIEYRDATSSLEKNDSESDNLLNPEYDENGTRELTDDEKQYLKDKLGWSDKKINDNCRIDKDGVIHYKTDCQDKEGTTSDCGVPYVRKTIEYKGVKIEGVFPDFDSVFDTEIDEEDYQSSSTKQFSECNKKLKEAIENDPVLKSKFTEEQINDIQEGRTPRDYTWHHTEDPGKMELVKTADHDRRIGGAAHTGGNSIWGNKSIDKTENSENKGESF